MINCISQYIKNISLKIPNSPQIYLKPNDTRPNIDVSIDIDAKKLTQKDKDGESPTNQIFEITLKIAADASYNADSVDNKDKKGDPLFLLDISYSGLFQITQDDEAVLEQILLIYCPNLLFPFLRRIVANVISDANLPPLMLEPIDFNALYNRRLANEKHKQEDQKPN
jgi:preprotein translocase subunit SecB